MRHRQSVRGHQSPARQARQPVATCGTQSRGIAAGPDPIRHLLCGFRFLRACARTSSTRYDQPSRTAFQGAVSGQRRPMPTERHHRNAVLVCDLPQAVGLLLDAYRLDERRDAARVWWCVMELHPGHAAASEFGARAERIIRSAAPIESRRVMLPLPSTGRTCGRRSHQR